MAEAKQFADAIHAKFPGKMLAYNCSPSFNWKRKLSDAQIAEYQKVRPCVVHGGACWGVVWLGCRGPGGVAQGAGLQCDPTLQLDSAHAPTALAVWHAAGLQLATSTISTFGGHLRPQEGQGRVPYRPHLQGGVVCGLSGAGLFEHGPAAGEGAT